MPTKINERYEFVYPFELDNDDIMKGYFARCYRAHDPKTGNCVAFKMLRFEVEDPTPQNVSDGIKKIKPRMIHYDAFNREANILDSFYDRAKKSSNTAWIPKLHSQGYFTNNERDKPTDGELEEVESVQEFCNQSASRFKDGWRPYLALEYFPSDKNAQNIQKFYQSLYKKLSVSQHSDVIGYGHLPIYQVLQIALQIARLFKIIHSNDPEGRGALLYPDSKLCHLFWNGHQVVLIDWNRAWHYDEVSSGEFTLSHLSESEDIRHFISVPLYGLLTGKDSARVPQPWFGPDANPPEINKILNDIKIYPKNLQQLFIDVLQEKTIENATALENRCEDLLLEMYGISIDNKTQKKNQSNIEQIFRQVESIGDLLSLAWTDIQKLYWDGYPDMDYLIALIDHLRERKILPWENSDSCSKF